MTSLTFEQENNLILNNVIENCFIKTWKKNPQNRSRHEMMLSLELFITSECNQTCSYCYLCQHGKDLYPIEYRNKEMIFNNLKLILNYCSDQNLKFNRIDLFSGEIWGTDFGNSILDLILEYIQQKKLICKNVTIPTNFSFLLNEKSKKIMFNYVKEFNACKVRLNLSCSNDGYFIDLKTRPLNNASDFEFEKGTKDYYDQLFKFSKEIGCGFHPMVAAHGIEYWKENFKWWIDNLLEKGFNPLDCIMFLEVRNDDWTDEKIIKYLEYLNFSCDYILEKVFSTYDNPLQAFSLWVHNLDRDQNKSSHYTPLRIVDANEQISCSAPRSLSIRLGDLAIIPCHRTCYNENIFGYCEVQDEKIVGFTKAKNIQLLNNIYLSSTTTIAECGGCKYRYFCTKGCLGAQLESNNELLYPCETVCNLYKARIVFLYYKYSKIGNIINPENDKLFYQTIELVKNTQEFKKWEQIVKQII